MKGAALIFLLPLPALLAAAPSRTAQPAAPAQSAQPAPLALPAPPTPAAPLTPPAPPASGVPGRAGREIDVAREEAVLTFATTVAAAHEAADALAPKDPRAAAAQLRSALQEPYPNDDPRALDLRADLFARVAELLLAAGDDDGALAAAQQGLAAPRPLGDSALTALLEVRRGEALEALGDEGEAIAAYLSAIRICKHLMTAVPQGVRSP